MDCNIRKPDFKSKLPTEHGFADQSPPPLPRVYAKPRKLTQCIDFHISQERTNEAHPVKFHINRQAFHSQPKIYKEKGTTQMANLPFHYSLLLVPSSSSSSSSFSIYPLYHHHLPLFHRPPLLLFFNGFQSQETPPGTKTQIR